jgi:hypothetical protein
VDAMIFVFLKLRFRNFGAVLILTEASFISRRIIAQKETERRNLQDKSQ